MPEQDAAPLQAFTVLEGTAVGIKLENSVCGEKQIEYHPNEGISDVLHAE